MLDFIFGFDRRMDTPIRWSFNLNHLLLITFVIVTFYLMLKFLPNKSKKKIMWTKISLISFMFILEVGRIIWNVLRHHALYGTLESLPWARTLSFTMCAINVWITIGTIIFTMFIKIDNKALIIFKNILYGSALLGGLAMFIYPENLDHRRYWHILHFSQSQTVLQHMLLMLVPLYLIKINEQNIRMKNIWMPFLGLIGAYTIIVVASHMAHHNFTFALYFGFFNLPYPFHKFVMMGVVFFIVFLLYLYWELLHISKNRDLGITSNEDKLLFKNKYVVVNFVVILFSFASLVFGPLLLGAPMVRPEGEPNYYRAIGKIAILLLIPLAMLIATLITTDYLEKKSKNIN